MIGKFDIVVIGAGVGGLICGCYLAKSGLKVLIVEQQDKPGGYCTSFTRKGYRFDVGVHYFGGVKKRFFGKILKELDLNHEIKFNQFDPADKIIMPDNTIYIRANPHDTVKEFKRNFPKERKSIEDFFKFVMQDNFLTLYGKVKKLTFGQILDSFFRDYRLKATIEGMLYNIGISAKKASGLAAIILYRDYLLDPGYYPTGGMQKFSDVLVDKFKEAGGTLIYREKVKNIVVQNKKVCGITLDNNRQIYSRLVVSNADASQVFKKLLKNVKCEENPMLEKLQISPALFVLYIGLNKKLNNLTTETCNIWKFNTYKLGSYFANLKKNLSTPKLPFVMASFPSSHDPGLRDSNKDTMQFFLYAPFATEQFWNKRKTGLVQKIIKNMETVIPNLKSFIDVQISASPHTFYKYTLNRKGSAYGWLSTVNQSKSSIFPSKTSLKGLFFVGHWCTTRGGQGGIPKVAFSGRRVAQSILEGMNKKWNYSKYAL